METKYLETGWNTDIYDVIFGEDYDENYTKTNYTRLYSVLKHVGVNVLGDLLQAHPLTMCNIPKIGRAGMSLLCKRILDYKDKHGVYLHYDRGFYEDYIK